MKKTTTLALIVLLLLGICGFSLPVLAQGQAGTTLVTDKNATGFWEINREYDWDIEKTVDPEEIEIRRGESGLVTYNLSVTRTLTDETETIGVRGEIYVKNDGDRPTENLKIVDRVQYKSGSGQFQDLPGASITIYPGELAAGEETSVAYEIEFTPVDLPNVSYRNAAKITITNHSGHLGEEWGPEPKADFSLPSTPTVTEVDAEADVTDVPTCPAGFSCTTSDSGPWHFTDSGIVSFTKEIQNDSATCDSYFYLVNVATLVESDTGEERTDSATVVIYTGPCSAMSTYTIGYWKTHAGFNGNNPNSVTALLPIWLGMPSGAKSIQVASASQAVEILGMNVGHPSNGITKLYAQLLAAKLNIANGCDGSSVAAVIAASDSFLAAHDWQDWGGLSKSDRNQVLGWMTALDNYNNGH